eukprot:TRINITY_DN17818_c0_g1_i1.p1 TRINITY_DN17818_c0_g1~~TRINITY_DN17818_c0_g1_i1.p1  ORF type:complete len:357 (-),score=70.42 TRINITY_DN17818_c0_g1_i1:24-1094(-)
MAFNLDEIKRTKLRKTEIKHDASAPKLIGDIDQVDIDQYQNTVLDINLEQWLGLLGEHTFASKFVPITPQDARVIMSVYERFEKDKITPAELPAELLRIESELDLALDEIRSNGNSQPPDEAAFIKTSSRSPKDTTVYDRKLRENYRAELSKSSNPKDVNEQIAALFAASVDSLKTTSARQAILGLLTSERVYTDYKLALTHENRFEQNLIVRKWFNLSPSMEFRGFYANGNLNALSQYNHLVYYPHLVDKKKFIEEKIIGLFYQDIKPRLGKTFKEYVVDFALVGDRVFVIELNPFLFSTDGCLFSWTNEKETLEKGPFEFRVRESPNVAVKTLLAMEWRDLLETETKAVLNHKN